MARKKKHEEHENLERWLLSYSDFITLLFATFVVLYALSQVDISAFMKLEDSMKKAFSAPSIMQGSEGLMADSSDSIFDSAQADSMITPLMMEYLNPKYEEQSFSEIEKSIENMSKAGELEGVEAEITDQGLVIRFKDDYLFKSGSAIITPDAKKKLDKVGAMIGKKFVLHYMRVEGHSDNQPIVSLVFPSNWELSSARASSIIRYLISRFSFTPSLFSAVGFAETRPIASNSNAQGRAKNRRIEILILRNKYQRQENPQNDIMKMSKKDQEILLKRRMDTINKVETLSDAAQKLTNDDKKLEENAIIINQVYEKEVKRLSTETQSFDAKTQNKVTGQGVWLKPPASPKADENVHNANFITKEVNKEFNTVKE